MAFSYTLSLSIFYLACGVFIFLLGLTILRTGTLSGPTRATALLLFFAGLGPILSATSIILESTLKEDAIVYGTMVENFEYLWEFYFPSLLLFSLTYPRENRFMRGFAFLGVLLFAPYIFHLMTIMSGDGFAKTVIDFTKNLPVGRDVTIGGKTLSLAGVSNVVSIMFSALVQLHKQLFLLVNVLYGMIALALLFRNMTLNINPRIAGQLRTVFAGITVSLIGYVLAKSFPTAAGQAASDNVSLALINFSLVAGGGSIAYAVVKQQFLGIKFVARKSILYGAAALLFAVVYLLVVKPVSDFFGQYSIVSKDAFETGFIILTIIAFQPTLLRIEDVLERVLLKGRDDLQTKFRELGADISNVTNEEELEKRLKKGFREILDATRVKLSFDGGSDRYKKLANVLEKIGGPVVRKELLKLGEKGRLSYLEGDEDDLRKLDSKERAREGFRIASALALDDEVFVPIIRDRRCVGIVTLGEKTYEIRYDTEELGLLSVISNQIGVALDNVRLLRENVEKKVIEEELQIARRIQSQLLPSEFPKLDGYVLKADTVSSRQVGGDYYDFELLDDNTLTLVVADVSGKGIPASLLMATLHAAVNSNHDVKTNPVAMMQRMNSLLYESTSAEEFATVFYGVVNLTDGVIRYANAGHEFPFVVESDDVRQLDGSGIVLGCIEDYPYEEQQWAIPAGGSFVLFTDGVSDTENADGQSFGEHRLQEVLREPTNDHDELLSKILSEVRSFSKDGEFIDDLTLVVLTRY